MLYKQKRIPVILPHKNRIRFRIAEQWQPLEEIISVSVASPDTDVLVSFRGVQKSYDGENLIVKHLDLDIRRGEFLTLLGPSGSGKTTFARAKAVQAALPRADNSTPEHGPRKGHGFPCPSRARDNPGQRSSKFPRQRGLRIGFVQIGFLIPQPGQNLVIRAALSKRSDARADLIGQSERQPGR